MIFSGAILICLTTLMLHSCGNENSESLKIEANYDVVSQADKMVKSSEYLSFNGHINELAYKVRTNYLKLSKANQLELNDLLANFSEKNDTLELKNILKKYGSILHVDIINEMNSLKLQANNIIKSGGYKYIDKRTLMSSIQKNLLTGSGPNVRFKAAAEGKLYNNSCIAACVSNWGASSISCVFIPPPADIFCEILVTGGALFCVNSCEVH